MQKLFEELYHHVIDNGGRYTINFENGTLVSNHKILIKNWDVLVKHEQDEKIPLEECLNKIKELYEQYEHAPASSRQSHYRPFYRDRRAERDKMLKYNEYEAKFLLEFYVLRSIINGSLYWEPTIMTKSFFYKIENTNARLYKSWFKNNQ